MSDWQEAKDPSGRSYYYHTGSGETSWEKPRELYTELELKLEKQGWKVAQAEGGEIYYYHEESGESRWEVPSLAEQPELVASEAPSDAADQRPEASESVANPQVSEEPELYKLNSKLVETVALPKSEAEVLFLEMLADHQIDSTWSFNKIISELSCSDPRYWCVDDDPVWKRKMFEQYLTNRSEDQLLKEHSAVNKFKEAFWSMLAQCSGIHYYTRWVTAKRIFANEPIYKHSVVSEKTKRKVFEEYVADLRETHFHGLEKTRSQAITELQDYLNAILTDRENYISWKELSDTYLFDNNARFMSNRHFQTLSKHDVLKEYVNIVESFSSQTLQQLESSKSANYTMDRKARDRFKKLLAEHNARIKCNTKWEDLYPVLKSDSRFKDIVGRNGSSPLDLFLDMVEEKGLIMKAHQSIANQFLIERKYEWNVEPEVDKDELSTLLKSHPQLSMLDDIDRSILVSKLIEDRAQKVQQQKEIEQRLLEQRRRFFTLLLHRVFSESRPKPATFEEARPILQDYPEFRDLTDEDERRKLFQVFEPTKAPVQPSNPSSADLLPTSKIPRKRALTPVELDY
ncbi:LADA_0H20120g1_1 [Lachancea dasiensis]|uniref:LADA_0H20120g1_1 n=1 Tax=Lachancea dasiensis TaxID=1072105 RepID=A0A1G4K6M3_9SACH|nr:LADA_0H20120g1_1 [Lachancea dasiensis]